MGVGYWQADYTMAGALLLGVVAIGGTLAHIRAKDGFKETFMIVLLGIIAFVSACTRAKEMALSEIKRFSSRA